MVAHGGIILWHDYQPLRRSVRDVCRALDELAGRLPLVRLRPLGAPWEETPGKPASRRGRTSMVAENQEKWGGWRLRVIRDRAWW
jgi:hypothetical protein